MLPDTRAILMFGSVVCLMVLLACCFTLKAKGRAEVQAERHRAAAAAAEAAAAAAQQPAAGLQSQR